LTISRLCTRLKYHRWSITDRRKKRYQNMSRIKTGRVNLSDSKWWIWDLFPKGTFFFQHQTSAKSVWC
jgi:hypothetical protein